jgi:hypothetical protein
MRNNAWVLKDRNGIYFEGEKDRFRFKAGDKKVGMF